ncbi:MAG: agmatinase family protein [Bdellovibrio sp.]|nr:agmatinase family protein [Bdellovibrio sp.]
MMEKFDPNAAAKEDSGIFGLPQVSPHTEKEAALVFIPVPWEATTSYRKGTAQGPEAILAASHQVDLFDLDVRNPYESGFFYLPESVEVRKWNEEARPLAEKIIDVGGDLEVIQADSDLFGALKRVNALGERVNQYVYRETKTVLDGGKIPAIVGGDHSVPFGAIQAASERYRDLGVLHFDAHSDTRKAYEGFAWSHASIMRNVMEKIPGIKKLVQVGIRDLCDEEVDFTFLNRNRIVTHYDRDLQRRKFEGVSWGSLCREILSTLPNEVWVSFDIDGLDPRFCPNTGTPVPGGLDFQEAVYLIDLVVRSGRKIVGFDLNEVAPAPVRPESPGSSESKDEWDANVGARLLYKMSGLTLVSQNRAKFN